MIRMLDTNICIYIIKNKPTVIAKKFQSFQIGDIAVSSIVLSELAFGVYNSAYLQRNLSALQEFMQPIEILAYDENAAYAYGEIRAHLKQKGSPIGQLDIMIAAHAVSLNAVLVTNNVKKFSRVKNLRCENWV